MVFLAKPYPTRRSKKSKSRPGQPISLGPFLLGLNTIQGAHALERGELSACLNFKLNEMNDLETRPGLTKYTNTAFSNQPHNISPFPLTQTLAPFYLFIDDDYVWTDGDYEWTDAQPGGTAADELIVTYPDNKLYHFDANKAPVLIDTLNGDTSIVPFGDYALILDGSYIKVWNRLTSAIGIGYDDGTGSNGFQHDNTDLTPDTTIDLYSGANTKTGIKFTTQAWDTGFTITATQVSAYLSKTGSPTGNIGCEIYDSTPTLVATSTTTYDSATLTGTAEEISFTFTSGALSTETEYWAVITYSGGSGANYVEVHYDTVASDGDGKYYDGSWKNDTVKDGVMSVKPGRPPKASFGVIKGSRAYLSGDTTNPGWLWYCNNLDPFDWSTSNGGGYIGAVDDHGANFPVGAVELLYGDIYVFGTKKQPYICKLTGDSPSAYALNPVFQRVYGTQKTTIDIGNDIWFGNDSGIDSMTGVEQYGDLRRVSNSDAIQNIFKSYWNDSLAIAAYNSIEGQYVVKLPNYPKCLVAHTKNPFRTESGKIRYPWTEYAFIQYVLTSSSYQWTASGSGTNEYYLEISGGGDPSINEPEAVMLDDSIITEGTVGSLSDHEWDYGDNDSLGYSTVYIRDNSGDPDSSGVVINTLLIPTAFANYNNKFFVGCHDGHIYTLDSTDCKDDSKDVPFVLAGKLQEALFSEINLDRYHVLCDSDGSGASFNLQFVNSDVDIDDLHSETVDVDIDVDVDTRRDGEINWNCLNFMALIRELDPSGSTFRIHQIIIDTVDLTR